MATFSGHVYLDANLDGTQDSGDTNLAGVTVNLLDGSGNRTGTSATTDSNGNVSFIDLAPGVYEVSVVTPAGDGVSQAINTQTPNTLAAGDTANATVGVAPQATPTLVTTPSQGTVTLSPTVPPILIDAATLANGVNPTGTITFTLVGPDGTTVDTEHVMVNQGNGTYTTPTGFIPGVTQPVGPILAGTYQWDATYSGDANNNGVNANPAEQVTVNKANPTFSHHPQRDRGYAGSAPDAD